MGNIDTRMCGGPITNDDIDSGGTADGGYTTATTTTAGKMFESPSANNTTMNVNFNSDGETNTTIQEENAVVKKKEPPTSGTLAYLDMLRRMHENENPIIMPPFTVTQTSDNDNNNNDNDDDNQSANDGKIDKSPTLTARRRSMSMNKSQARIRFAESPVKSSSTRQINVPKLSLDNVSSEEDIQQPQQQQDEDNTVATAQSKAVMDTRENTDRTFDISSRSSEPGDTTSGKIDVTLFGVKGLPISDGSIYVLCDMEDSPWKQELRSAPVSSIKRYPQWNDLLGELKVNDYTTQALRINV